jgi:hypothetical protein
MLKGAKRLKAAWEISGSRGLNIFGVIESEVGVADEVVVSFGDGVAVLYNIASCS